MPAKAHLADMTGHIRLLLPLKHDFPKDRFEIQLPDGSGIIYITNEEMIKAFHEVEGVTWQYQ